MPSIRLALLMFISAASFADETSKAIDSSCTSQGEKLKTLTDQYQTALASVKDQQRKMVEDWNMKVAEIERQAKQQQSLLDKAEQMAKLQESALAKTVQNQSEFEKILSTWKSQQTEYQKYLDSLPKNTR